MSDVINSSQKSMAYAAAAAFAVAAVAAVVPMVKNANDNPQPVDVDNDNITLISESSSKFAGKGLSEKVEHINISSDLAGEDKYCIRTTASRAGVLVVDLECNF